MAQLVLQPPMYRHLSFFRMCPMGFQPMFAPWGHPLRALRLPKLCPTTELSASQSRISARIVDGCSSCLPDGTLPPFASIQTKSAMSWRQETSPPAQEPMMPPPAMTCFVRRPHHLLSSGSSPSTRLRRHKTSSSFASFESSPLRRARDAVDSSARYMAAKSLARSLPTKKVVRDIPRGWKISSRRKASKWRPETTSMTRPATSTPWEYIHCVPGWKRRGSSARASQNSRRVWIRPESTSCTKPRYEPSAAELALRGSLGLQRSGP
mmetsp:Transcript_91153/g.292591  ORF Transcript_91153/g.292591 Transcript_91153/m.292591 type:complete len:266 (-) Transcript_91153:735-1532(-)